MSSLKGEIYEQSLSPEFVTAEALMLTFFINHQTAVIVRCGLVIFMLTLISPVKVNHGQQSSPNNEQQIAVVRDKAYALLQSLSGEINTLQSAENRARLGSNIAESLWSRDETRARAILVSVENDIRVGLEGPPGELSEDSPTLRVFLKLRADTVERIARHDVALAFQFLKATELSLDRQLPAGVMANQQALELQIAKRMANENPETAVEIGRRSLAQGFSNDLLSLLIKLQRKHQDQASALYKEVVSELQNKNLEKDWNARPFAVQLVRSYVPNALEESAYRDLINKLVNTAFTTGCNKDVSDDYERGRVCNDIGSLLSAIEKIDPHRASQLKRWNRQIYGWERTPQAYQELNEVVNQGSVDDVLALALEYPEIKRDIYWQGVTKALAAGDSAKARQIADDYKENPEVSRDLLALIDSRQNLFTNSVLKFEEIQKTLGKIPRLRDQAQYLIYIAGEVGRDNRTLALKLLDQGNGLAVMMDPGKDQTEAQIALAIMYCHQKSEKGWEIMESLLPKLNDLIAATAKLDGYETHNLRDGEWDMSAEGTVGSLLTMLAKNAGYFAWNDFDRAVNLTGQFERPEIRVMAQVKLAQSILAGPPSPLAPLYSHGSVY